jgi:glycosyltransferase involved in cell wall biosynthesis/GT2 family glycosyltransferase
VRAAILDMQPIDPPVGGGRLRLLGLYHALGLAEPAVYVGTYDWPGEAPRDQMLTPDLREVMVPLSEAHFAAARAATQQAGGRTVIDSIFHQQVGLSPDFLQRCRAAVVGADVVIYSHPWLFPATRDLLDRSRQLVVYDAHNIEGKLRTALLDDHGGPGTGIARDVIRIERELSRTADLVLACSHADGAGFSRLYGVDPARIRVIPNGAFTERQPPADAARRAAARKALRLPSDRVLAIFLGSSYGPNIEAGQFLIDVVAPANPDVTVVIAGGVSEALSKAATEASNLILTGRLNEADKQAWLDAADIALNPMFSGSGTNIKMLEFMAAGLPILTTPTGARGIDLARPAFRIASRSGFAAALRDFCAKADQRAALRDEGLSQVRRFYSWERISRDLGRVLVNHQANLGARPRVSVIIPTYGRHPLLSVVIRRLADQAYRDFEVVVVDQSEERWPDAERDHGIRVVYVHSDVRGAVTARNTGARIASGDILAFTDDDCEPPPGWLAAGVAQFDAEPGIAGLEGLIVSGRQDDPDYRTVTNDGFEGIGFMTANLFVKASVFQGIGGFDIGFENPHFREDTDLGWRAQAYGAIPFSRAAWLYHPPHKRDVDRESLPERSRYFVKDARLMWKHPERYTRLFLAEKQWRHNPHFLRFLAEGLAQEGTEPTPSLASVLAEHGLVLLLPASKP